MDTAKESSAPSEVTTTRRYPPPKTWMEWTSERRDLLEICEPKPQPFHDSKLPELPTPQREGVKLTDRSRGCEYTLKTHIVPGAWPRSTPDVGYPAGCDVGGLRERGALSRVREEMLEVKKRHLRGELSEGRDKRQYWVCVNRYVRNGLEETERNGKKRLTLFLTHAIGFGKEASAAEYLIPSTSFDTFAVLGTGIAASTAEPRRGRSNYRRGVVLGDRQSWGFCFVKQREAQLTV